MSEGIDLITTNGLSLIHAAVASNSRVQIKYVALGDGGGVAYDPGVAQTSLRRELARVEIDRRYPYGEGVWWVTATVPAGTNPFTVREIAFLDEDGEVFSVWAGADIGNGRQIGAVDFVLAHFLDLSVVAPGLITIAAPNDELTDFVVTTSRALMQAQMTALTAQDERRADAERLAAHERRQTAELAATERRTADQIAATDELRRLMAANAAANAAAIVSLQRAALTQN